MTCHALRNCFWRVKLRVKNLLLILLLIHSFYAVAQTSTGTGFFITANGYLATNYHVIDGAEIISVRDTAGTFFKANIVATDKINDLAILYVGGTHNSLNLLPSQGIRSGKKVFTMGFPHIDIQGAEAKFTEGSISSSSGLGNDPRVYQISVPVQAGNSGGPLATQEGGVVGIVTAKIDALSILKSTGDLPQNVNYAIKSSYLLGLVSAFPEIEKNLLSEKKKTFTDTQKLAEHLSKSIVLIFAESPEVKKSQQNNKNSSKESRPINVVGFPTITPGHLVYLDLDSVKKDGDFVTFDVLDKPTPKYIETVKSNCNENGYETLKRIFIDADGSYKSIMPNPASERNKKYVPNTYWDAMTQYGCGKKSLSEALLIKPPPPPPCEGPYCK
jgi:Trypsin-like peptidase domain